MADRESVNITEDEAALYDRQIRLWGLDAQKRLRAAAVLLVGVGGIGAEVAKNIVLAGVNSLLLLDHRKVTEVDFCSQFLLTRDDIGKNRAQSSLQRTRQLNPMVSVSYDTADVADKKKEFFKQFDVVCATGCSKQQLLRISKICHEEKIKFFAGDVHGYYGVCFADLQEHVYVEEKVIHTAAPRMPASDEPVVKKKKTEAGTTTVQMRMLFTELADSFNIDWSCGDNNKFLKKTPAAFFIYTVLLNFRDHYGRDPNPSQAPQDKELLLELRNEVLNNIHVDSSIINKVFVDHCFGELSPVCAITGGVLGQEIIKAVSKRDEPHNNFFFYDGVEGSGLVDHISPSHNVTKEACLSNAV
ncbi:hypothetical protein LSH36_1471g00014 [Paralvinella palmiformis]|uniref:SUMO-activating enzyme subunit 1 n=1 Tax=Paralvinella palmiformis TaxID=53620 RepID=A0AAD9IU48_9ANNE|nr:hypothetical protein LSH36_1471g00014 [Paralvinella palmiformis]